MNEFEHQGYKLKFYFSKLRCESKIWFGQLGR